MVREWPSSRITQDVNIFGSDLDHGHGLGKSSYMLRLRNGLTVVGSRGIAAALSALQQQWDREEVSSLLRPRFAVLRHPPQRGGPPSPQRPTGLEQAKAAKGSFAPRACKPLPNLPRFACADLRCAPPSALLRVGIPLGLHLLPPTFARRRSACTCRVSTRTLQQQPQPRRRSKR